jgi:hypothetical protein
MSENRLLRAEPVQLLSADDRIPEGSWIWNVPSFDDHRSAAYPHPRGRFDTESYTAANSVEFEHLSAGHELERAIGNCRLLAALIGGTVVALPASIVAGFFGFGVWVSFLIYCGVSVSTFVLLMLLLALYDS